MRKWQSARGCIGGSVAIGFLAACTAATPSTSDELVGSAQAAITNAPPGLACLAITAASSAASVTQQFALSAGESTVLNLAELPLGSVTFSAAAYAVTCASVTASLRADWISDPTVTAVLTTTNSPTIALAMHQNGAATVGVDFGDAGVPGDAGVGADTGVVSAPFVLAAGRSSPLNLAIDATNVYWTENNTGGVYQVAKTGGPLVTLRAPSGIGNSVWAITTDATPAIPPTSNATHVFWTDRADGLVGVAAVGGASGAATLATSPNAAGGAYGIAFSATGNVYVTDFGVGKIWSASATARGVVGTSQYVAATATGLATYGNDVIWTSYDIGTAFVNGAAQSSGMNNDSRYVTTDGVNAYWTASDGGQVWYAPLTTVGSSVAPIAISTSESQPWGVASDAPSSVYWVNKTNGAIQHAVQSGSSWTIRTVAIGNSPSDIRVDASYVYWTDSGSGTILRAPK